MFESDDFDIDENFLDSVLALEHDESKYKANTSETPKENLQPKEGGIDGKFQSSKSKISTKPLRTIKELLATVESCNENNANRNVDNSNKRVDNQEMTNIRYKEITKKRVASIVRKNSNTMQTPKKFGERKFPGPAGLLPDEVDLSIDVKALMEYDLSLTTCKNIMPTMTPEIPVDPFQSSAWLRLQEDLVQVQPNMAQELPDNWTLAWLNGEIKEKSTPSAVQANLLFVVIKNIVNTRRHPISVLKDPTGEMRAALMNLSDYQCSLIPGAALLLQNVRVLKVNTSYYLIISKKNIVSIYGKENVLVFSPHRDSQETDTHDENIAKRPRLMFQKSPPAERDSNTPTEEPNEARTKAVEVLKYVTNLFSSEEFRTTTRNTSERTSNTSKRPAITNNLPVSTNKSQDTAENANIFEGLDMTSFFDDF